MSDDLVGLSDRFLSLNEKIKELEAERDGLRKELAAKLPVNSIISHSGKLYEWVEYERTSTGWKGLYSEAYRLLDDQGQVIMGEVVSKATTSSTHFKFSEKKP